MPDRKRSLIAVITSMVVVNLVYGLTLPLLSLVLDAEGISKTVIGLSIVAQASAGIVIAPFVPRLMMRIGPGRLMQLSTLLAATTLLALGLFQDVYLWFPLRFLLGASAAMLWSASEAVINDLADDNWRGRIIGIYGSAGAAGFAMGPLVLVATGTQGLTPFLVTAILIVIASLPLLWLRDDGHDEEKKSSVSLRRIFRLVPQIMMLNLTYAAAIEAFIAFFPLFGIHIGLGEARSLSMLTVFALGGVVLQLPLGWLADHVNRQRLLLSLIVLTMVGFIILPQFIALSISGPVFLFSLGGVESMIYVMGVILLGQRFRGTELASASVLFTGMWAAGTTLGPAIVGAGMDLLGNDSMPYLIAAIYACYLPVYFFSGRCAHSSRRRESAFVAVVGGANIDIHGKSNRPLRSNDSNPGSVHTSAGGVARNVAENLARLGVDCRLVSAVGNDYHGQMLLRLSREAGVDVQHVQEITSAPTSTYLSVLDDTGDMQVAIADMSVIDHLNAERLKSMQSMLQQSALVIVDANLGDDALGWLTNTFADKPIFADTVSTSKAPRLEPYLSSIHTLKTSTLEAEALTGLDARTPEQLAKVANHLHHRGVERVFVTRGEQGVFYSTGEAQGSQQTAAGKREVQNAGGAGDAFLAGLAYAWIKDFNLNDSIRFSMTAADITLSHAATSSPALSLAAVNGAMEAQHDA